MSFIEAFIHFFGFMLPPPDLSWEAFRFWLVFTYIFYLLYVLVMGVYRVSLSGQLTRSATVLLAPVVLLAILVDIVANWTVATVLFWEWPKVDLSWPPKRPDLVTSRLSRYLLLDSGYRRRVAFWVCSGLLDAFDPSGKHCT